MAIAVHIVIDATEIVANVGSWSLEGPVAIPEQYSWTAREKKIRLAIAVDICNSDAHGGVGGEPGNLCRRISSKDRLDRKSPGSIAKENKDPLVICIADE
jgi:hypothetical protein